MSGTYQCEETKAFQVGLPLDKLWLVTKTDFATQESMNGAVVTSHGALLRKAIFGSDEAFLELQKRESVILSELASKNPECGMCLSELAQMRRSRVDAIGRVGYLTVRTIGSSRSTCRTCRAVYMADQLPISRRRHSYRT